MAPIKTRLQVVTKYKTKMQVFAIVKILHKTITTFDPIHVYVHVKIYGILNCLSQYTVMIDTIACN